MDDPGKQLLAGSGFPFQQDGELRRSDSGDTVETNEEDQFCKFIEMDGVSAAWVSDHYINGKQSSRINYESIQYNQTFPSDLFTKPANIKAIK